MCIHKEYDRAVYRQIRQLASSCGFTDLGGELISHVIQATTDSKLRKQGLKNDALMLKDIIEAGRNNVFAQDIDMERDLTGVRQDIDMERDLTGVRQDIDMERDLTGVRQGVKKIHRK